MDCKKSQDDISILHTDYIYDILRSYFSGETSLAEMLDKAYNSLTWEEPEPSISQIKKQIKHCKNPLEKKQLERKLNELYKERKKK